MANPDLDFINDLSPDELLALVEQLNAKNADADRYDDARRGLLAFAKLIWPGFEDARHIDAIIDVLEKIERGELRRLIIAMPPRHGKTFLLRLFSAWYMARHPKREVIFTSYSSVLAEESGGAVKDVFDDDDFTKIFPHIRLRDDSRSKKHFQLTSGGKFTAVGMGGTITGKGAHLLIVDDPIKGSEEADSITTKRKQAEWYQNVASTRLQNEGTSRGAVIICATRWAEDDLTGWALTNAHENWHVLSLPAVAESEDDALGREIGEALWPQRYPIDQLHDMEKTIGARGWNALYQQRPSALVGNLILRDWWKPWPRHIELPDFTTKLIGIDMALSEKKRADCSAMVVVGLFKDANNIPNALVLSTYNKHVAFNTLFNDVQALWLQHRTSESECYLLCESATAGISLLQELQRRGLPVMGMKPDRDKVARVQSIAPLLEMGKVWFVQSPDNDALIEQSANFPNASRDDMVDAFAMPMMRLRAMNMIEPARRFGDDVDDFDEDRPFNRRRRRSYW